MMEGTTFETSDELREELGLYPLYSDTARPHNEIPAYAGMTVNGVGMTGRGRLPLAPLVPFPYAIPMTLRPNPDDGRTPSYGGGSIWPHFGLIRPYFGLETPRFSPAPALSAAGAQE